MTLQHLLDDLGARIGAPIALDALGTAQLWIDDMPVILTAGADDAHLTATVTLGPVDGPRRAEVLGLMLKANYLWAATKGATLSLTRNGDAVLMNRWPAAIDTTRLAESFAVFLDTAEYWNAVLAGAARDRSAHVEPSGLPRA